MIPKIAILFFALHPINLSSAGKSSPILSSIVNELSVIYKASEVSD